VSETLAVFQAEVHLDVDTVDIASASIRYEYNGEIITYQPQETWIDGNHLLHLLYYIPTEGGAENELLVSLKLEGGTGWIDEQNVHAMIWGQGLVASDKWDGRINLEGNLPEFGISTTPNTIDYINGVANVNIIENINLSFDDDMDDVPLDTVPVPELNYNGAPYINKKAVYDLTWQDVYELVGGWQELYEDYNW
jgi:hypothetical protein